MKLAEATPAIEAALERLLRKERSEHPFVIIEDDVLRGTFFVQFGGDCPASEGKPLVFDVPRLRISEPVPTPAAGAKRAIETLQAMGLPANAELRLIEHPS